MRKISVNLIIVFTLVLTACQVTKDTTSGPKDVNNGSQSNNKSSAIYWQQNSAEYEALCYQAFNIASMRLNSILRGPDPITGEAPVSSDATKPYAIVMDLDETVIDNSAYYGYLMKNNLEDTKNEWREWSKSASAEIVPGAQEFIEKVNLTGIPVFFISNRGEEEIPYLIRNLSEKGIQVNPDKLLLFRKGEEHKYIRRNRITSAHSIVMLIGDNLADFSELFESDIEVNQRVNIERTFKQEYGNRFIILPNVLYGGWEIKESSNKFPNEMVPVKDISPYIKTYK